MKDLLFQKIISNVSILTLFKDYDDWTVTFAYDSEVVNLEAWKGDVSSINQTTFEVKSRCYNSKLYACQVILLRI